MEVPEKQLLKWLGLAMRLRAFGWDKDWCREIYSDIEKLVGTEKAQPVYDAISDEDWDRFRELVGW